MLRFYKATYLSLLFKFILSERLSNSLLGSDFLIFPEFINIVSVLFYKFIEFIILLYTFLAIFFSLQRTYDMCDFTFVSFQIYYLLLLVQVLLVIFEAFV